MNAEQRLTLGEGNTPLILSRRIGLSVGLNRLYFKLESLNPTGSYKDRFAAAAVTDMLKQGRTRAIGTSSGNAGAAMAAYCAAAGMSCIIAVVCDAPEGKLKQMLAYGAKLWKIKDFGLDPDLTGNVLTFLQQAGQQPGTSLQVTAYRHSPVGMAGVESISHELLGQLDDVPDHVFVCSGGGGLILAISRGFESALREQRIGHGPRIHCVQPTGNDTIAGPLRAGSERARSCARSTTRISGLQVPNLIDGQQSLEACRRSNGTGFLIDDDRIYELQSLLAKEEGIFCEPAAAVPLAGALQAADEGLIGANETVVCLITGAGFKDPAAVDRMVETNSCPLVTFEEFQTFISREESAG